MNEQTKEQVEAYAEECQMCIRDSDDRSHVFLLVVVVDTSEEGGDGTFPVRLASQGGHTVGGQWNRCV